MHFFLFLGQQQDTVCFHMDGNSEDLELTVQGWKHSPTINHGLIQTALEHGEGILMISLCVAIQQKFLRKGRK